MIRLHIGSFYGYNSCENELTLLANDVLFDTSTDADSVRSGHAGLEIHETEGRRHTVSSSSASGYETCETWEGFLRYDHLPGRHKIILKGCIQFLYI